MTSAPHALADLSLLVKAWAEPRELEGLEMWLRGSLEVLGSGHELTYWRDVPQLHETIDAVLRTGFPSAAPPAPTDLL